MLDKADFIRESIEFLHRYMMKSLQKYAEEHDITVPQVRVISEVLSRNTVSIKQLSQNLKMTQSTASDIVERLTAKGILLKTPNPRDKRSIQISLSDEMAKGMKENASEIIKSVLTDVLSHLQPNEQESVQEGLRLLVSAVKEKMEGEGIDDLEPLDIILLPRENEQR